MVEPETSNLKPKKNKQPSANNEKPTTNNKHYHAKKLSKSSLPEYF